MCANKNKEKKPAREINKHSTSKLMSGDAMIVAKKIKLPWLQTNKNRNKNMYGEKIIIFLNCHCRQKSSSTEWASDWIPSESSTVDASLFFNFFLVIAYYSRYRCRRLSDIRRVIMIQLIFYSSYVYPCPVAISISLSPNFTIFFLSQIKWSQTVDAILIVFTCD